MYDLKIYMGGRLYEELEKILKELEKKKESFIEAVENFEKAVNNNNTNDLNKYKEEIINNTKESISFVNAITDKRYTYEFLLKLINALNKVETNKDSKINDFVDICKETKEIFNVTVEEYTKYTNEKKEKALKEDKEFAKKYLTKTQPLINKILCWLYTYTDNVIDGIIIIKNINGIPKMLYNNITDNIDDSVNNIKTEINNDSKYIDYNKDTLKKYIKDNI
jgi:hypothetical protein